LEQPCQIDDHWKIKIHGKELSLKELQIALIVEGDIDRKTPGNTKTTSNRIALIRADHSAPWFLVSKVIEACARALIWKIEYGAEAMPVYLPKQKKGDITNTLDELRISLIHNPASPLTPTIRVGIQECKDLEALYSCIKEMAPSLKKYKIPLKICSDNYVPFQIVLNAIKIVRKCDESLPIEFSTEPPTPPIINRPESMNWGQLMNGLQCRIGSDKDSYKIGEPVQVAIEIRNGTEDKMIIWHSTFAVGWQMNGQACQTTYGLPVTKPRKEESQIIMPNEVFNAKEFITNLSIPFSAHYGKKIFIKEGEYRVSLEVRLYRLNEKDEWEPLPVLTSNTITIEILNGE
jgi:hypothetical protein